MLAFIFGLTGWWDVVVKILLCGLVAYIVDILPFIPLVIKRIGQAVLLVVAIVILFIALSHIA